MTPHQAPHRAVAAQPQATVARMKRVARAATEQAAAPSPQAGWAAVTSQVQARAEPVVIQRAEPVVIQRAEPVVTVRAPVAKAELLRLCVTTFFRPSIPILAAPWAST